MDIGHVRVVVVKTKAGKYKRAITDITILPIDNDDEQQKGDSITSPIPVNP